ncbi:MAG: hypothetical protein HEEMFOPI_00838 [Holosporales bacterium]
MKIKYLALALLAATYAFSASKSEGVMGSAETLTSASQSEKFMNTAEALSQRVLADFEANSSWDRDDTRYTNLTEGKIKFKDPSGNHVVHVHKKPNFKGEFKVAGVSYSIYQIISHTYPGGIYDIAYAVFSPNGQEHVYVHYDQSDGDVNLATVFSEGSERTIFAQAVAACVKEFKIKYSITYSVGPVDPIFRSR